MIKRYMHLYDGSSEDPEEISRFVDERFPGFAITGFTFNFGENNEYSVQFSPKNEKEIFGEGWAVGLDRVYNSDGIPVYEVPVEEYASTNPSLILGASEAPEIEPGGAPNSGLAYSSSTQWEISGDVQELFESWMEITYSDDAEIMVAQEGNFTLAQPIGSTGVRAFINGNELYLENARLSDIKKRDSLFYTPYLSVVKNTGSPSNDDALFWNPKAMFGKRMADSSNGRFHVTYRVLSWDTSGDGNAELVSSDIDESRFHDDIDSILCDFTLISPEGKSDTTTVVVFRGNEGPTIQPYGNPIINPDTGSFVEISTSYGDELVFSRYYEGVMDSIKVYPNLTSSGGWVK